MLSRRTFALGLLGMVALVAAGCGQKEEGSTDGTTPPKVGGGGGGGKKVVGVSLTSRNHNFFIGMEQGVTDELKAQGLEAEVVVAENDATTQQRQIDTFIRKGVAAIIMVPADATQAATPVEAANKANIPIFCIDRRVTDPNAKVNATIETDNVAMGEEAAKYALKLLCERYKLDPSNPGDVKTLRAKVIHNWGIPEASSAQDRAKGFEKVFNTTNTPNVSILKVVGEFNANKSQAQVASVLRSNPDVDLIYCHNDDNAIGSLTAILDVKKTRGAPEDPKRILIVGMDGNKPAIEAIRKGDIEATVSQEPIQMGQETVKQVKKVLDGSQPDNAYIPIPYKLITRKEADELKGQLWADRLRDAK